MINTLIWITVAVIVFYCLYLLFKQTPVCAKCGSKSWDTDLWPHRAICRICGQDIRL